MLVGELKTCGRFKQLIPAQRSIVFSLLVGLKTPLKTIYNFSKAKRRALDLKKPSTAKDNKAISRTKSTGTIQ
jgi:hypothetical protein